MARTIRLPKEIGSTYDGKALVVYATRIAEYSAKLRLAGNGEEQ